MDSTSRLTLLAGAALGVLAVGAYTFSTQHRIRNLELALKHEESKRAVERKGRISAEKSRANQTRDAHQKSGHLMKYIAHIESPFPDRRGTPRQPMLVPAAHGRIRFDKQFVQTAHFAELADFSHVFILFVFHENTNIDKETGADAVSAGGRGAPAKIAPPRLGGKKVGCLSTRSPHRPNPIGLSVCEVLRVGDDYIDIKSIDFVHGTPVLDIKPMTPYDLVPSNKDLTNCTMALNEDGTALQRRELSVPSWIVDPDIPMRRVTFSLDAEASLNAIALRGNELKFCEDAEHAKSLIMQVLRQDVRGLRARSGSSNTNTNGSKGGKEDPDLAYMCRLDVLEIRFSTTAEEVVVETITTFQGAKGSISSIKHTK